MANSEDITRFTAVDHTQEPDFFRRFLDEGNKIPDIVSSKPIILSGLRLTGGERVLDLGCGLGDDTFEIARVVGSRGRAVGVDVSETMILEARRRAASLDLAVEFEVGDAQALRFDDGAFDACRTERMLMHVPDAERAFAEMARVVCRGGRLSVFDFDWETQIVDSPYPETTRLITLLFGAPRADGPTSVSAGLWLRLSLGWALRPSIRRLGAGAIASSALVNLGDKRHPVAAWHCVVIRNRSSSD